MIYEKARYHLCGDKFMVAEYGYESTLWASYKVLGMRELIKQNEIKGIIELCPGSASLMINYDPFVIKIDKLILALKECEKQAEGQYVEIPSRILTVPIWYNDPWTTRCAQEFKVRNNLEWTAEVNGLSVDEFISLHSSCTFWVTSIGFSPGSPAFLPINPQKELIGPKYKPRTWTPRGALGLGGNSNVIYAMRGPGGVAMLGITPLLLSDVRQRNPVFKADAILFRPGDRIKIAPIGQEQFEEISRNIDSYPYEIMVSETIRNKI
jgi:urea carboxylase